MNKVTINEAGQWSAWSEEKLRGLEQGRNNVVVGEKLVYRNAEFQVWMIHLPAGQALPFHRHAKRYFWTAHNDGKSRSYYDDGSIRETEYVSGDTVNFPDLSEDNYFIHNLENIGDTMLVFTTVEFLDKSDADVA